MNDIIEKLREDRKFFFCLYAFTVYGLIFCFAPLRFSGEIFGYTSLGCLTVYCCANIAQKVGLAWAEAPKLDEFKR